MAVALLRLGRLPLLAEVEGRGSIVQISTLAGDENDVMSGALQGSAIAVPAITCTGAGVRGRSRPLLFQSSFRIGVGDDKSRHTCCV